MSRRPKKILWNGKKYPSMTEFAASVGVTISAVAFAISRTGTFRGKKIERIDICDELEEPPRDIREEKKAPGVPGKRSLLTRTVTHGLGLAGRS